MTAERTTAAAAFPSCSVLSAAQTTARLTVVRLATRAVASGVAKVVLHKSDMGERVSDGGSRGGRNLGIVLPSCCHCVGIEGFIGGERRVATAGDKPDDEEGGGSELPTRPSCRRILMAERGTTCIRKDAGGNARRSSSPGRVRRAGINARTGGERGQSMNLRHQSSLAESRPYSVDPATSRAANVLLASNHRQNRWKPIT